MVPSMKLCMTFTDRLGIVADIAQTLSEHFVSITAVEVAVDTASHIAQVHLALDLRESRYTWEEIRPALEELHGLLTLDTAEALPRERRETWLRAVLDTIHDGILAVDDQGRITGINREAETMLGLAAADCIGRTPQQAGLSQTHLSDSLKGQSFMRVPRHLLRDASRTSFLASTRPIRDDTGRVVGAVEILKDMGQVKELAQAVVDSPRQAFASIVGTSAPLRHTIHLAQQVARTDAVVCLRGESGTGKELFAQAIHTESGRTGDFIAINCAALPEPLLENELFGYAGGAFTGARREGKPGLFELAKDGTLFLDEIAELPPGPQAKLLRALQEKAVRRICGSQEIRVNARIITATSKDLEQMIARGSFREDLFYRINVLPIFMPPLRERLDDLFPLVDHFLFQFNARLKRPPQVLTPEARQRLMQHDWPGNIRELRNVIERAAILSEGEAIGADAILFSHELERTGPAPLASGTPRERLPEILGRYERQILSDSLRQHGSIRQAARALGISHTALLNKIKKYAPHLAR